MRKAVPTPPTIPASKPATEHPREPKASPAASESERPRGSGVSPAEDYGWGWAGGTINLTRTLRPALPRLAPILAAVLCALFIPGAPAHADATGDLASRLASILRDGRLGDRVGFEVAELESGRKIFSYHDDLPLNPASNMTLVTEATALRELGPSFRMLTGVYGQIEPGGTVQEVVLRGFGDPTLRMADLVDLADQLRDRGVQRVQHVVVDGSYFDDQILPPLYDQQPDEVSAFRAAVGAVSVDHSAYELRVLPGPSVGAPARVQLDGAGYFDVDNAITTKASGAPDVVAIQRPDPDGLHMKLLLRGTIPQGILGVSYWRRIEQPLAYAGWAMVDALGRAGIHAEPQVTLGPGTEGLPLLVAHHSPEVETIIHDMGKNSDNYVAEMLLKVVAAEKTRPGNSARGTQELQATLAAAGVKPGAATLVNGSGLFVGNAIAVDHLVKLLTMMYRDPAVRAEYIASLAVGGVDGTLEHRLTDLPAPRIVRAKTGTLHDTVALSGYVLSPTAGRGYAFSFLANGVNGKVGQARKVADGLVTELANELWKK